ncbi:MAG: rane protein related to metalloendopeptidase [Glaciihabitans sp.]|nr:rane protein related to metalloendopeptidase [Glaciihabitans sp.]
MIESGAVVSGTVIATFSAATELPQPTAMSESLATSAATLQLGMDAQDVATTPAAARAMSTADDAVDPHTFSIELPTVVEAPVAEPTTLVAESTATVAEPVLLSSTDPAAVPVIAGRRPRKDPAKPRVRKMRGISARKARIALAAPPVAEAKPAARTRPVVKASTIQSRIGTKVLSGGALLFAGALIVAMSVPASAFTVPGQTALTSKDVPVVEDSQAFAVTDAAAAAPVSRETFSMSSVAELQQSSLVRVDTSYTINNAGEVRWPFPVAVPISDGYGARVSPCSGCSSLHKGTDFTPGVGTAIAAIADGVVSVAQVNAWGFGNHVMIDHVINGQKVTSLYAHMQLDSSDLKVGDVIKKGDYVGLVGATGAATGPHLHFEIRLDGVQVNPFLWLQANTES